MRPVLRRERARPRAASRRVEVERVLAAHGLGVHPDPLRPAGGAPAAPVVRLGAACRELGPVFAAFARDLAQRPDLLAPADCLVLASVEPVRAPLSPGVVARALAAEIGARGASRFGTVDPEPLAVDWPCQLHRGRTTEDGDVLVEIVLPGAEEESAADIPLLELLTPALAGLEVPAQEVIADFRRVLARRLDLTATRAALASLAADDGVLPPELERPRLSIGRCTRRLLVTKLTAGEPLEGWADRPESARAAQRLWLGWLGLVFEGSAYPQAVLARTTFAAPGGRTAFAGGPWAPSLPELRPLLRRYFEAEARQDVESACEALVEMQAWPAGGPSAPGGLFLALRQGAPFRDGSWTLGGDTVVDHVFLHWRLARRHGLVPAPALVDFQRAFAAVAMLSRQLAAEADPLAAAMDDRTLRQGVSDLYDAMGPQRLAGYAGRYMVLLAELPARIETALRRAGQGAPPGGGTARTDRALRSAVGADLLLVAAFAAALVAAGLLVRGLTAAGWPWAEPAAAALVTVMGLSVLRGLGRRS